MISVRLRWWILQCNWLPNLNKSLAVVELPHIDVVSVLKSVQVRDTQDSVRAPKEIQVSVFMDSNCIVQYIWNGISTSLHPLLY